MDLSVNIFCLIFSSVVASAFIFFSFKRDWLYVLRLGLLLFPLIEMLRRIIVIHGEDTKYPLLVIITQVLIRLIGPFYNWHIHLQLRKKINWTHPLNLLLYGMAGHNIYYTIVMYADYRSEKIVHVLEQLTSANFYTVGYSFIQLVYFAHAGWLLYKEGVFFHGVNKDRLLYFMKTVLIIITSALVIQQGSYIFYDIYTVDFIITPLIIASIYASLLFISVKSANIQEVSDHNPEFMTKIASLSNREKEVLERLAAGKTDKEIAYELEISVGTVNTYCKRIYGKLKVNNRTEASIMFKMHT